MEPRGTLQTRGLSKPNGRLADDPVGGVAVAGTLGGLVRRLQKLEQLISGEKGEFDLFGLFLPEDSPNMWDLVVAAKWIGDDQKKALDLLAVKLKSIVGTPAMLMISKIVLLSRRDRFLTEVLDTVRVEHRLQRVSDVEFGGVSIEKGFIITSRCPRKGRLRARR